jgi:hypothetical protein
MMLSRSANHQCVISYGRWPRGGANGGEGAEAPYHSCFHGSSSTKSRKRGERNKKEKENTYLNPNFVIAGGVKQS